MIDDPFASSVIQALACRATFEQHAERVAHFVRRMAERGDSPGDTLIVLINMDDPRGTVIGEGLMPGHDWKPIRDAGQVPYARGLAGREGIQEVLAVLNPDAAEQLRTLAAGVVPVVVIDHGTAVVFAAAARAA